MEFQGRPGKSQKEGQEDKGEVKELGGTPLGLLGSPGPPGLPSGSSLACLGGARRSQEELGGSRGSQEEPGGARRSQNSIKLA